MNPTRLLPHLLGATALTVFVASLACGPVPLSLREALAGSVGIGDAETVMVVREVRLPRALVAMLLGAALAMAGLLLQTLADNRLAAPSVLGIHNGANLGAIIALVSTPSIGELAYTAAALGGAAATTFVIAGLGAVGAARTDRGRWILGGVLLDQLAAALTVAILLAHAMNHALLGWMIGRLLHVDWQQVSVLAGGVAVGGGLATDLVLRLDPLRLGDDVARSLGTAPGRVRFAALVPIVCLAGTATAVAGPVAYVGLIVPNIVTRVRLPSPIGRLWGCALGGAVLTGSADLLVRAGSTQRGVPLGVATMAIGATVFLAMTLTRRRHHA